MSRIRSQSYILVILLPFILSGLISQVPLPFIFSVTLAQLVAILLPGMLICRTVVCHTGNRLSFALTSYAIGLALFVVIYAILLVSGLQSFISHYGILVGILSIVGLVRSGDRESTQLPANNGDRFILVIFYIILLLGCVLYQIPHLPADLVGSWEAHPDDSFMLKGCISSVQSYPVQDLSAAGTGFYWHMFSLFTVAGMHYLTGLDCFTLLFTYSYVWNAILLVGGAYFISRVVLSKADSWKLCVILLLFTSGLEGITYVQYITHLYGCTLGCAQATAAMMYSVGFMWLATRQNLRPCLVLLSILFYALTMGSKTSHGAVVMVSLFSLLLFCRSFRPQWICRITSMLFITVIFFVIAKLFALAPAGSESFHHGSSLYLKFDTFVTTALGKAMYTCLRDIITTPIAALFTAAVYFFSMNLVVCVYFVIAFYFWIRQKSFFEGPVLALFAPAAAGILLYLAIYVPGFSQCYFAESAMPFAILFLCYMREQDKVFSAYIGTKTFYALLVISVLSPFITAYDSFRLEKHYYFDRDSVAESNGWGVIASELEGLRWAREHLASEEVLCTNKAFADEGDRSFVTSCFTEHQIWVEGYMYGSYPSIAEIETRLSVSEDYYNSPSYINKEKIKREGVHYSIHYKSIHGLESQHGEVMFENESIAIVKL